MNCPALKGGAIHDLLAQLLWPLGQSKRIKANRALAQKEIIIFYFTGIMLIAQPPPGANFKLSLVVLSTTCFVILYTAGFLS